MRALVLSGGGSKGAFQVGVLKRLIHGEKYSYDIFCGTSVGALNASFMSQFDNDEQEIGLFALIRLWAELSQYDIYSSWPILGIALGIFKKSLYNSNPLKKFIKKKINPADVIKQLRIVTASLTTGEMRVFTEKDIRYLHDAIYASAAFPVMFEPIKIDDQWYSDGGLRDLSPLKQAIDAGADEIHIINCSNINIKNRNLDDATSLKILPRVTEIMNNEILLSDLKVLTKINVEVESGLSAKKYIRFKLFQPSESSIMSASLTFDHREIMEMISNGYSDSTSFYTDRTIHNLIK
jgi:NTE family protein